jgi:eukaryotic-like serine/threonine-protein kinase
VAFSPDGRQLASAGADGSVRVWDLASRRERAHLAGHRDAVHRVAFGRMIASASRDGTVCLWDTETYRKLAVLDHGTIVYGLAFSPDGTRLATGCRDNTIRLWDLATYQQVCELRGHTDYVHAVAFSHDGTQLVSGSGDFTVRFWDTLPVKERMQLARSPKPIGSSGEGRRPKSSPK